MIGAPEIFKVSKFLQNGEINNEFIPFSVSFGQYEISRYFILRVFSKLAKNSRKLSVISISLKNN